MTLRERILVAMSGGVDSSVAAAWLVDRGYDVVGVTLHLWDYPDDGSVRGRCCAPEDQHDARRVADALGIPHYSFDRREQFDREVVTPFVDAYLTGQTPSPCVVCNRTLKIRELMAVADRLGAAKVATGHYARIAPRDGGLALLRGRDRSKDQSYFLHAVEPAHRERLVFPLGEATKTEVRSYARDRALPGADKGESHELCFVPTGRYDNFVEQRAKDRVRPGPIVDGDGTVVGTHAGIHRFTIGQRKGLGVALGEPAFVVGLDADTAAVRLGGPDELMSRAARLSDVYLDDDVVLPASASVQVRYRHEPVEAVVDRDEQGVVVRFASPVRAVAVGQQAVAYAGERVLGGGTIREAWA